MPLDTPAVGVEEYKKSLNVRSRRFTTLFYFGNCDTTASSQELSLLELEIEESTAPQRPDSRMLNRLDSIHALEVKLMLEGR